MDHPTGAAHSAATAADSECSVKEEWTDRTALITVSGVLDMLTSPRFEARLTAAFERDPAAIIIDMSDIEFLASAGMAVLVAARERAGDTVGFAVVASGPATSRPLKLVGLAELVGLYPSLAEARATLQK